MQRRRRLHRALLLAYLADRRGTCDHNAADQALQWEFLTAQEALSEIVQAAKLRDVRLDKPPPRKC